ncbi:hypothetical protein QBL07_017980 [Gordonia rubripertincta]|uniref:Uncharacterized protein n=1 Tax=Gordonia rubripertincta TaxID=36822 RepID=A0AAW6R601_GORRU|nr:hypothetical protein [Gordonia rubripertincta]MDG6779580.1 hypothetical protein [Gordonia rubripertincta]NKY62886.1 hypothetical protein [Gordonia rubripertincta]
MGDLSPGDRRMLARMRAERDRGTAAGRRLPLPEGASFVNGDVHEVLRKGGYVGAFKVSTDDDGERFAVLTEFDRADAWRALSAGDQ